MTEKPADDDRFYRLLERLFKEIDQDAIQADVTALRASRPNDSREALAEYMTRRAARRVAGVGAAAGLPGGPLAMLAMAPDIFNLVLQQSRLILSIAFLYGRKANLKQRSNEVLATLAVATGVSVGRLGVRALITEGIKTTVARKMAKKIFGRFVFRRLPMIAPVLGTVAGASLNYVSMRAVGKAAVNFYKGSDTEV